MPVSQEEFKIRTNLCLRDKIKFSQVMIRQWYEVHNGKVYVAFSGGKDSTVLLHLVRFLYPEVPNQPVHIVKAVTPKTVAVLHKKFRNGGSTRLRRHCIQLREENLCATKKHVAGEMKQSLA